MKEKLACAEQDKSYFEAFLIEYRRENTELKEKLLLGERTTMDKIKRFAKKQSDKIYNQVQKRNADSLVEIESKNRFASSANLQPQNQETDTDLKPSSAQLFPTQIAYFSLT